jgi:hypothetical protein
LKSLHVGIALIVLVPCLVLGLWEATYPGIDDPKNIHYLLWKSGFASIDLDRALGTMTHDAHSESLVLGKSEDELRKRFGYLRSLDEASSYLRNCYQGSYWNGQRVMFLRNSWYMVVFKNGKATDLVLVKGC